jgi:hypothetical protein
MAKIYLISYMFLLASCSTYSVTVLHNEIDPLHLIDPMTELKTPNPECKAGFTIKTNKPKEGCTH